MMLALRLGRTLEELGRTMSSQEFSLWTSLYRENQWGEQNAYERAGIVASTVANYAGMQRSKDAGMAQPREFMPYPPKQVESDAEVETEIDPIAYFNAIAAGTK